jgi:hypothetical protein
MGSACWTVCEGAVDASCSLGNPVRNSEASAGRNPSPHHIPVVLCDGHSPRAAYLFRWMLDGLRSALSSDLQKALLFPRLTLLPALSKAAPSQEALGRLA